MMDKATRAIHVIYTIKTQTNQRKTKQTNLCDLYPKNTNKSTKNKTDQFM